ncbi:MAG: hypothetical protein PHT07_24495 [Paludibacter sp.]|nr:hypothetical protein [Paludibacter sp.]
MYKLAVITKCSQCPRHYSNYMPDGKNGKEWCGVVDKETIDLKDGFPELCPLETLVEIEQQEPDYNDGTNGVTQD